MQCRTVFISAAEKDDWTETGDGCLIARFCRSGCRLQCLENRVKSVLVLEKMNVFEATPALTADRFPWLEAVFKRVAGIKDSPKLMEEDMLRVGAAPKSSGVLVKAVVKESPSCYDMMVKCACSSLTRIRLGGHSAPRTIFAENYSRGGHLRLRCTTG